MDPSHTKNTRTPTAPLDKLPRTVDRGSGRETPRARDEEPEVKLADIDRSVRDEALMSRLAKTPERTANLPKLRDMREDVFFRAEYLYLHKLINLTGHNIRRACELSGLSRSRLYTLLKKYQISSHYQITSH